MKALEVRGICKMFPGNLANDNISFSVEKGEIFAIVGENGAGKSTLMNIIYGIYTPTGGNILVNEQDCRIRSVEDAIKLKMGMVHQEFMLIPRFTVTQNIVIGDEPHKGIFFDYTRAVREVRELSERVSLAVNAEALVADLPVGVQQRVEILKVLASAGESPRTILEGSGLRVVMMEGLIVEGLDAVYRGREIRAPLRARHHCGSSCAGSGNGCG